MKLVLQRTTHAKVSVDGKVTGEIGKGLMVLVGFGKADTLNLPSEKVWNTLIDKMIGLRIFEDEEERMNLSLQDVSGELLIVSQFTLYGSCKKGRRPSFTNACSPEIAKNLYDKFVEDVRLKVSKVQTGIFGAMMEIDFVNDGPVTMILDSEDF